MLNKLRKVINKKASVICSKECAKKYIPSGEHQIHYAICNYKKLQNQAIVEISEELSVAKGTVVRWIELKNVPPQYSFDIMKMNGETIDYSKFSDTEKDQFFTPNNTVQICYDIFKDKMDELEEDISEYTFVEPSAGAGAFLKVLPKDTIALDIEPQGDTIQRADYLDWTPPEDGKYIVFGNPPFGLRGNLALRFIRQSEKFADFVCFILPQLFESDGKGSPRKRIKDYNLVHSQVIDSSFNMPDGRGTKVNVVFQIWSKNHKNFEYELRENTSDKIKIYSLSDGGTPSTTRNKKMHDTCDIYLPSTCYGKENMRIYSSFGSLPGKKGYGIVFLNDKGAMLSRARQIDWSDVAFLSTNSAYNLRTSKILEILT
jgi:hypothetical protein